MKWLPGSIAAGAVAVGTFAWGAYLHRRRQHWRGILRDSIPVNSKWWRDYHKHEGELLYVAIGDSTAQGIGASTPGRSYVGDLAQHIRTVTGKTVRVTNLAVAGSTVYGAYADQLPRLAKLQPDVVTVSTGSNNIVGFHPARFEKDLRRLFAGLPAHSIVSDLPSHHFLPAERRVRAANQIVRRLADEFSFPVAPIYERTRSQGLWGVSTQFAGDLYHPNDRGYKVWASAFIPSLDAALKRRDGGAT